MPTVSVFALEARRCLVSARDGKFGKRRARDAFEDRQRCQQVSWRLPIRMQGTLCSGRIEFPGQPCIALYKEARVAGYRCALIRAGFMHTCACNTAVPPLSLASRSTDTIEPGSIFRATVNATVTFFAGLRHHWLLPLP